MNYLSILYTVSIGLDSDEANSKPKTLEPQLDFVDEVVAAIKNDESIRKKLANIMLVGLPGSGKSTLLDRLLGIPIKTVYYSTGISEYIVIVDIGPISTVASAITRDSDRWQVVDLKESILNQLESLMEFVPQDNKSAPSSILPSELDQGEVHQPGIPSVPIHANVKLVLEKYEIKSIKDLSKTSCLYIRDTGGQIEFQESLSLMIYGPSIFIYVFKTNIDINTKHIIQYRSKSEKILNEYESSISTKEALIQCLTSISSSVQTRKDYKPVVFIVGTHLDMMNKSEATIKQIDEDLDKEICRNGFSDIVQYSDWKKKQLIFTVNNLSEDEKDFKRLCSSINKLIFQKEYFTVEYPVSYLLFCLDLQRIHDTVLSVDNCKKLAAKYMIPEGDITKLLHFLHFQVGIIQHYNVDGLKDLVIKEPQILFNRVTDLILKTFLSSGALTTSQEMQFIQKGIIEESVFEDIVVQDDNISPKQFIDILLHLRMMAYFTDKIGKKKYFIPCVLNHVPEPPSGETETKFLPLTFTFECGHCPKGLFGVLVTHLMMLKNDTTESFALTLQEDKIYRDQVSFTVKSNEELDEITLKMDLHLYWKLKYFQKKINLVYVEKQNLE